MNTNNELIDALPLAEEFLKKTTFGELVRHMREADNISQSELASRVGVSRQFLNAIEHEKRIGNIDFAIKVAKGIGYSEDLFIEVCLNDMLKRCGVRKIVELKLKKSA